MRVVSDAQPIKVSTEFLVVLLELPLRLPDKLVVKAQNSGIIQIGVVRPKPVKQARHRATGSQALAQFDTIDEPQLCC